MNFLIIKVLEIIRSIRAKYHKRRPTSEVAQYTIVNLWDRRNLINTKIGGLEIGRNVKIAGIREA